MNQSRLRKTASLATASLLLSALLTQGVSATGSAAPAVPSINKDQLHALVQSAMQSDLAGQLAAEAYAENTNDAIIASDIDTTSSGKINVIIQLSGQPAAVGLYAAKLGNRSMAAEATEQTVRTEQNSFLSAADAKGIPLQVNYKYDTVLNGMEVTIAANQIPNLAKIAGIRAIHKNLTYYAIPVDKNSLDAINPNFDINPLAQMGVDQAWALGLTGKGLKIGVIDTGADYVHPDLAGAFKGGYDAFNKDGDPYEDGPINDYEGSLHGTHVSGTIAGRAVNPTSDVVQKGVAYEADLYDYKVLGGVGEATGSSAQIIDGIEHAVKDGMDVINLSLGNAGEKDPNSPDSIAINNAVLAGVVAVVANGNDGATKGIPYYYSMGAPASSQLAISVGAATSTSTHYSGSVKTSVEGFTNGEPVTVTSSTYPVSVTDDTYGDTESLDLMAWGTNQEDFHAIVGSAPIEGVYVGLGDVADYAANDVRGKVAFISRGTLPFDQKIRNAKEAGALAAVIFNGDSIEDESGLFVPDLSESITDRDGAIGPIAFLGDSYKYLPTFDMPGKVGRQIAKLANTNPGTLQFTFGDEFMKTAIAGDRMADFSSRGPNSDGNYSIKPDVSAPGVNILSTLPAYGKLSSTPVSYDKAYGRLSGTSMATPHVAGLVLLLKQEHPSWSPMDIRAALANTADEIEDESGTKYDVYSQGAGRVDVASAIKTPALLEAMDDLTLYDKQMKPITMASQSSSISFGMIDPSSASAVTKPLQLKYPLPDSQGVSIAPSQPAYTYTAKIVMHPHVTSDPHDPILTPDVNNIEMTLNGLDASGSDQITVSQGGNHNFTLSAKAKQDAADGVYEGEVLLENPELPSLHLPFVIHIGDGSADNDTGVQNVALSSNTIYADQPIDISAMITAKNMNFADVEVLGVDGEFLGTMAQKYGFDYDSSTLLPIPGGTITYPHMDGTVTTGVDMYGNNIVSKLPDGLYELAVTVGHYTDDLSEIDASAFAFKTFYVTSAMSPASDGGGDNGGDTGGGGGGGPVIITPPPATSTNEVLSSLIQQGQTSVKLTPVTDSKDTVLTVTVTDDDLKKALAAAQQTAAAFIIDVTSEGSAEAQLKLTDAQVKQLQTAPQGSSIYLSWNGAAVAFPVAALSSVPAGSDLVLSMAQKTDSKSVFTKQYPDAAILGTPYSFEASSVLDGASTPIVLPANQAVKRAFLLDKGIDASSAGALYTEGDIVSPVPAQFSQAASGATIVTISRPGFSTYAAAARHVSFTDINSSWAKNQIQVLADQFLLNGTAVQTFSPKGNVTRAEFAAMLVRSLGLQQGSALAPFSDVTSDKWYAYDVAAAYQAGLITGIDGKFLPAAAISRQDLAVMLARALKLVNIELPTIPAAHAYADAAQIGSYAKESIQAITDAGLMQGVEKQGSFYFQPATATTREAVAKVLNDLLQSAHLMN